MQVRGWGGIEKHSDLSFEDRTIIKPGKTSLNISCRRGRSRATGAASEKGDDNRPASRKKLGGGRTVGGAQGCGAMDWSQRRRVAGRMTKSIPRNP